MLMVCVYFLSVVSFVVCRPRSNANCNNVVEIYSILIKTFPFKTGNQRNHIFGIPVMCFQGMEPGNHKLVLSFRI